jgi:hypothetical protein
MDDFRIFHPSSYSGLSLNCFKKGIERAGRARIDDFGNSTPLPFRVSLVKIARSRSPLCHSPRRNYSACSKALQNLKTGYATVEICSNLHL